jgi:hypothetical protein
MQYEGMYREDQGSYRKNHGVELHGFVGLYSRLKKMHSDVGNHHDNALADLF